MNSSINRTKKTDALLSMKAIPVPRQRFSRHDPTSTHTLVTPMWLEDTRFGRRYAMVAGNATGGLLRPFGDPNAALPRLGQRLTLLGGRVSPVRFVVQADDMMLKYGERVLSVKWVVLSAPDDSQELRRILRDVLKVQVDAATSPPTGHSRLVYHAERKTLRSLSTLVPTVSWTNANPRQRATVRP